jgi:hypothetical protein
MIQLQFPIYKTRIIIDFVVAVRCEVVNILSVLLPLAQDQCWSKPPFRMYYLMYFIALTIGSCSLEQR